MKTIQQDGVNVSAGMADRWGPMVFGVSYIFGVPDEMPFDLPAGWEWKASREDWLFATGPDGKRYVANKSELHLLADSVNEAQLAEKNPKNYRPQ